jgi:hypothetical protein
MGAMLYWQLEERTIGPLCEDGQDTLISNV